MAIIEHLEENHKIVSIVGMSKNAGKTVTLNRIIEEASDECITIGLTSTGRDGENTDLVTNTEKPMIYVEEGTLIATATQMLDISEARGEILEVTDFITPLGEIVIARIVEEGYIQISGPSTALEIKKVSQKLLNYGAELVLIDGAINRRSSAAPFISEATVIATGAVLSRNLNKVIENTIHVKNLFSLNTVEKSYKETVKRCIEKNKICTINEDLSYKELDIKTAITGGKEIAASIEEETRYVVLPGSMVKKTVEDVVLSNKRYRNIKFVVRDGTKIFIEPKDWLKFKRAGFSVEVLDKIEVLAITINPYSPSGYYFSPDEFLQKMRDYIPDVPVYNVMEE